MMDYTMPRADNLPNITVGTENTLCTHNPLGVERLRRGRCHRSPPAIINAVVDALKDYGVRHIKCRHAHRKSGRSSRPARPPMAAE